MEVWKAIEGYEGLYEVSNFGRVRSLIRDKLLSPKTNCITGYLEVNLYNGSHRTIGVHRLVAKAFLSNPNYYKEVNHKDEDKTNNLVSNLEWCEHRYNTSYGTRNERLMESNRKRCAKLSQKEVEKIKLLRDNKSVREIAHMFGVSDSQVYRILKGVNWREIL